MDQDRVSGRMHEETGEEIQYEEVLASGEPVFTTMITDTSVLATMTMHPLQWLTFGPCNIRINCATGEVTIPPDLELSDAARAFWNEVERIGGPPGFVA
ncbi:MAG TPA: hypothetical protein VGF65_07300 [Mycobacterium sp.]|jgi:hypothetical protein